MVSCRRKSSFLSLFVVPSSLSLSLSLPRRKRIKHTHKHTQRERRKRREEEEQRPGDGKKVPVKKKRARLLACLLAPVFVSLWLSLDFSQKTLFCLGFNFRVSICRSRSRGTFCIFEPQNNANNNNKREGRKEKKGCAAHSFVEREEPKRWHLDSR